MCKKVEGIYNFYKKNNFKYIQFNPCLEPLENTSMTLEEYSLTPKEYEEFLIKTFDLWYKDALNNNYVSIRLFDNILGLSLFPSREIPTRNLFSFKNSPHSSFSSVPFV